MKRTNFAFLVGVVLSMAASAFAANFTVNNSGDTLDASPGDGVCADASNQCTLRAAIGEANALPGPDTINLPAGTYTTSIPTTNEDANANGDLDITADLTITGAGEGTTFVQANAAPGVATDRVIHIPIQGANVTIEKLTVRNGRLNIPSTTATTAGRGGGIQNLGNLTLRNMTVSGNQTVQRAGGIHSLGANTNLTLSRVTISGNSLTSSVESVFGAGLFSQTSNVNIGNSTITNNTSTSTFTNGLGFAAGAYMLDGIITINNSSFTSNTGNGAGTGGSQGTGLRINSSVAGMVVNVSNTSISNNTGNTALGSSHGGTGMAINNGVGFPLTATLTNVTINGNNGSSSGGGLSVGGNGGTVTITNSNVTNNNLATPAANNFGGGIALLGDSTVTLNSTNVTGNSSTAAPPTFTGFAGGIYNQGGTVILNNSNLSNNTADSHGGIRCLPDTTNLFDVTTTINSSTINGNTSTTGGGIVNIPASGLTSTLNVNNSTISGNTTAGAGGGIWQVNNAGAGTAITTINNSTISGNAANTDNSGTDSGGGVSSAFGTVTFKNTILSDNTVGTGGAGPDCSGTLTSANYNLIENPAGCTVTGTTTNNVNGDPGLLPLAFNGGFVRTHAIGAQSLALNAGDPTNCQTNTNVAVTNDERGLPRSQGGVRCDIGAFERGGFVWTNSLPTVPSKSQEAVITPTDWNDPANWAGGVVPGVTDYAIFGAANPNNVVVSTPVTVAGILYGSGYNGTMTLNANLTVTNSLQMNGNNIVVNGSNNLIIGSAGTLTRTSGFVNGNLRKDVAGAGSFTYPVGVSTYFVPATINVTGGTGSFTVKANLGVLPGTGTPGSLFSNWTLTPSGVTTADVTFNYPDTDFHPDTNEASFQFARRSGGSTTFTPPTSANTTTNVFTLNGVATFSDWTLGIPGATAAGASISGRVLSADGRGIANVKVVLTGGDLVRPLTVVTGKNGRYELQPVSTGQTYVVTVSARRFTFSEPSHVVFMTDSVTDLDFISDPPSLRDDGVKER